MNPMIRSIALVTDFGVGGPYVGQLLATLHRRVPGVPVYPLMSDLPPFRPDLAAYLLPALVRDLPKGALYLCVVDPGVGSDRNLLWLNADGNRYLGPDNGMLAIVAKQARKAIWRRMTWQPRQVSASFHGRDILVPAAARLVRGKRLPSRRIGAGVPVGCDWPDVTARILYVDRYGNLMTGLRAAGVGEKARLRVGDELIGRARTFADVAPGAMFWYENSLGLVEIAVNQGAADQRLGLRPGDPIHWEDSGGEPSVSG